MRWFKRKPKSNVSAPQASEPLMLLLVRPALSEIFSSSVDPDLPLVSHNPLPEESAGIMTSHGLIETAGLTEDMFCPVAILAADRYGRVGYTSTARLDLRTAITRTADQLDLSIDQFFIDRDILIFTQGYYQMALMYSDPGVALRHMKDVFNEQTLPKLCHVMTWTDTDDRKNLRGIEARAELVLAPRSDSREPVDLSDLPVLGGSWRADVLDNLFLLVDTRMSVGAGGLYGQ